MACREIVTCDNSSEYVIKHINSTEIPLYYSFPYPQEVIADTSLLVDALKKLNLKSYVEQAIVQQYNEIILYDAATLEERLLLAPQISIKLSPINKLPTIIYPRFTPLMEEKEVWNKSERDCMIALGARFNELHIPEKDYRDFLSSVSHFCDEYGLRADDILLNPSNIGWHPILGLRIIDYGLCDDRNEVIQV